MQLKLALTLKLVETQSASRDKLTKGQPMSTINAMIWKKLPGRPSPSS